MFVPYVAEKSPMRVIMSHSIIHVMMTSSNGNIFRVTGHLCGEFTGPRWIPRTKVSDPEFWCFLWSASEYTVEYTIVRLVNWDATVPIMTSPWWMLFETCTWTVLTVSIKGNNCYSGDIWRFSDILLKLPITAFWKTFAEVWDTCWFHT